MTVAHRSRLPRAAAEAELRRAARARTRRRAVRRRRSMAGLALATLIVVGVLLLTGGAPAVRAGANHLANPAQPTATRPPARGAPAALSPGSLPQTRAYPSGTSGHFKSLMASLWTAVVDDSLPAALRAFFPRAAYVQLKAIPAAASDWTGRLVRDYGLDIGAAHTLLGRHPSTARLVAVDVPARYGHWIAPGHCYNSIGYYEMPNARMVYRQNGQIRSFGIASMISWRGVWYVVHFGGIRRPAVTGMVDDPAPGRGTSAYSGTC